MPGGRASPHAVTPEHYDAGSKSNTQVSVDCESFAQKFFETAKALIAGDNVLTLYYHADNNTRPSKARTKSDQMRSISLH